jgi:hypothetical protein
VVSCGSWVCGYSGLAGVLVSGFYCIMGGSFILGVCWCLLGVSIVLWVSWGTPVYTFCVLKECLTLFLMKFSYL